ncbi:MULTISPECIES: hypothetical protein [Streptomyces]|nr:MULTISPECIES: hypothetical protein [Streptomyces]MDI5913299.1 hypothetical protein [Streptomyces sp. 12257]
MGLVPAVRGLLQCGAHVDVRIRREQGHPVQAKGIESVPGRPFRVGRRVG